MRAWVAQGDEGRRLSRIGRKACSIAASVLGVIERPSDGGSASGGPTLSEMGAGWIWCDDGDNREIGVRQPWTFGGWSFLGVAATRYLYRTGPGAITDADQPGAGIAVPTVTSSLH